MVNFANTARNPSEIDLLKQEIEETYETRNLILDEERNGE